MVVGAVQVTLPARGAHHGAYMAQLETWTDEQLRAFASTLYLELQRHEHSFTCGKGGHKGDDSDCRLRFPRPLVPTTKLVDGNGLGLKRSHESMVHTAYMLQPALPTNMALVIIGDRGYYDYDVRRHRLAKEAGLDPGDPPKPVDHVRAAHDVEQYVMSYGWKTEDRADRMKATVEGLLVSVHQSPEPRRTFADVWLTPPLNPPSVLRRHAAGFVRSAPRRRHPGSRVGGSMPVRVEDAEKGAAHRKWPSHDGRHHGMRCQPWAPMRRGVARHGRNKSSAVWTAGGRCHRRVHSR